MKPTINVPLTPYGAIMQSVLLRFILLALCTFSTQLSADAVSKKDTIESRYIYTLGYRVGQSLTPQQIQALDQQRFAQGVRDKWNEVIAISGTPPTPEQREHEHYRMGYLIGQSLFSQGIKHLDIETLLEGIKDALPGKKPRMDELEMMDVLSNYQAYQQTLRDNSAQKKRQMRMDSPAVAPNQ